VEKSLEEIETILQAMGLEVPAFMGQTGPVDSCSDISPAADFIIEEALRVDKRPLYILCQGAITNVAVALRKNPAIRDKMTVIWIGTHGAVDRKAPFREFNAGNDIKAANEVLQSWVNLWLVPSDVYSTVNVGISELELNVAPCGKIGRHLFENLVNYNLSDAAGWTQGESWSLGDSPAIALAINPGCGKYVETKAPLVLEDTSSVYKEDNPVIRVYTSVDSRYILGDFFAKLKLNYGETEA
jgi:inosine-uridine nucleoside N-ribohydrolase